MKKFVLIMLALLTLLCGCGKNDKSDETLPLTDEPTEDVRAWPVPSAPTDN